MLVSWTAAVGGSPALVVGKQRCRHQRLLLQLAVKPLLQASSMQSMHRLT